MAAKKRRGAPGANGGGGGRAGGGPLASLAGWRPVALALAIPRALTVYPDTMLLNQPWTRRLWEWLDGYIGLAEQWLEQRGPQLRMASLLVLTSGLTLLVAAAYSEFRSANNDSFYHIGLAREYAKGWVDSYKWLPHTPLAQDPFPNLYLLMHLVLAPVHWVIHDGMEAHKFSRALAGVAMMGAVFWAQWMFRNPLGLFWTLSSAVGAPIFTLYLLSLKGGALFFPLAAFWFYALVHERIRWLFLLAFASSLAYAGSWVLVGISAVYVAAESYHARRPRLLPFTATLLATALGLILHPAFPLNIEHILNELSTPRLLAGLSHELEIGFHIGTEWDPLDGNEIVTYLGFLATALVPPLLMLRPGVSSRGMGALSLLIAMSLGSIIYGSKMLIVTCIAALVLMPWIWQQVLGPRLRWQAVLCAIGLVWGVHTWGGHLKGNADAANVMREELAMGAWLRDNTPKDSKVAAFWHHYPKFIYGGESHNRFLAGMNTLFLLWGDPIAYRGFLHLFDGSLSDPEVLLAQLGFDYWLIDNTVNQRFQQTMQRARSRPGLAEVPLAQGLERFKLFRVLPPGTYPTAPPPQPAEAAQGQEGQEAAAPQPAEAAPAAPPPEEPAPAGAEGAQQ